ncbi:MULTISPECIES: sensor histidine kinase KdpD [unclassified Shinella]|uniref:sensor histidine kinase n=1 Tax=unclassified Shinella TaxID=2643062 RepID=UPI00225D5757|nr:MULTISPECIES: sensor histidine kinase KdpD [unclassified Shinella]MCO5140557.1 sensor histidine kinase KdpD [Shinella sp.]MDC7254721.1 sensor histidine kinase KdpD [Shinella sp. YE25]CAI0337452.1 sensor histidine kinase KdpD [Rhizobiaceae bacterium]CAK7255942.1 sensor histidine kinase KdpD [Shinella sp. WSC3-e]
MSDDPIREQSRPSPDALLESAQRETRGHLKIFLGAAPGVGKTYEMLMSGRAQRADGIDVVIGVVETHGRAETEALVEGFEIVPRRTVPYRGHVLDEMDIDAILARKPALVLVDELAHTNAPGSRHPKRYLDVEELLANGIDVYSTLNIQHVESLNDVVAQITRIRVRETVPDSIIDRADDIEIIDITPGDLIKRLNEGKVYLPKTAKRATQNYFSPSNLTALRELALRRTAQRVDDQLVTHMQAHAIAGPWSAGERVLVCINERPGATALVRYGRRQADRLRAPWAAVHVETSKDARLSEQQKDKIASALRLAEQLGAEAVTLPGENVAQEILAYASTNNYTHVIVGMPTSPRWREIFAGSVSHDLIRAKTDVSVHVISPGNGEETRPPATLSARPKRRLDFGHYLWSSLYVAVALGIGTALSRFLDVRNIALVFLMAVLASAMGGGLWPALFASVVGALVFNFFFLEPRYTLDIGDPESVVAFAFFLGVAVIASNLAGRVQRQAVTARQRAKTTEGLYLFSKKLAGAGTLGDVLWATVYQIASMLQVRVVALLPENGRIAVQAGFPPDDTLDDADIAAAQWAWEHDKPAGRGADTLPGAKRLYLPLKTGRTRVGVIGLDNDKQGPVLTPAEQRLFDSLADQAALAIERIQLVADVDNARLAAEADKLRSALLTSLSHDLKTPLASILGSAGALRDYSTSLTDSGRVELLTTIVEEAERLNRFIANLLDMTRLESGAAAVSLTPLFIGDSVGSALRRAEKILALHKLSLAVPPDLPMVRLDPVLFEQVLFNLLDNARKYAPTGSLISIRAWAEDAHVVLQIVDEGPGMPSDDLTRIFDSFYRVRKKDHVQAGTGLGLSICKGFVEAMGGTILATNRADRPGAIFTLRFPIGPEPSTLEGRI